MNKHTIEGNSITDSFPLKTKSSFEDVVLIACGSFNPPHFGHLNMFSLAKKYMEDVYDSNVIEGIISPVADTFGKSDLVSAEHRLRMSELAASSNDFLIRADGWECSKVEWTRTVSVLRHHHTELKRRHATELRLIFLCGADVFQSWTRILPNGEKLWSPSHLRELVTDFGAVVINRHLSLAQLVQIKDAIQKETGIERKIFESNVMIVEDANKLTNGLSSTQLRKAIHNGQSIKGLTPDCVIEYISKHKLYV